MTEFILSEGGRLLLLVLAGIGFLLQVDNLIDSIREARKGGDSPSDEEEPSPPDEPAGGSSKTSR